jgi:hypothetical protein
MKDYNENESECLFVTVATFVFNFCFRMESKTDQPQFGHSRIIFSSACIQDPRHLQPSVTLDFHNTHIRRVPMEFMDCARGLLAWDCIHLRSAGPVMVSHIHLPGDLSYTM